MDPEKLEYMSGEGRMFETFKSVFIKVSILMAETPYTESAGTHLKTASGTFEMYLFIDCA